LFLDSIYFSFNMFLSFFLLSFSMLLRQPRSTLFPYTTLFRSTDTAAQIKRLNGKINRFSFLRLALILVGGFALFQVIQSEQIALDRKSTRLNSSHVKISYAVFCLKKKKIKLNKYNDKYKTIYY